jgi:hypothetical protein
MLSMAGDSDTVAATPDIVDSTPDMADRLRTSRARV